MLLSYIHSTTVSAENTPLGRYANVPVIYCTDVPKLIDRIKVARKFEEGDEVLIKIGIDGGGGFLKITISLLLENHSEPTDSFKDGGVKRLLILAVVPDIPEKYEFIKLIWINLLKLDGMRCVIAGDLKIINVIIGIMAHSSSNPCPYCEVLKKELSTNSGPQRTIGSIRANCCTEKIKKACCIHNPLIHGSDEELILTICPPPPLHLSLGIVNAVYKAVEQKSPDWADLWAQSAHVRHQERAYGFTGRACYRLINAAGVLQDNPDLEDYFNVSIFFLSKTK